MKTFTTFAVLTVLSVVGSAALMAVAFDLVTFSDVVVVAQR